MKRITCSLIMFLMLIPFMGCENKQPPAKKPVAEKVVPAPETKKDIKQPEETAKVEQEVYAYDAKGRRDPFMTLVKIAQQKPERKKGATPVESYGLDVIRLLAIAWDKEKYYALIMLPDKKSYTIKEGMALGLYGGKVEKITKDTVVIREFIKDYRGNLKPKDTILKLREGEGE